MHDLKLMILEIKEVLLEISGFFYCSSRIIIGWSTSQNQFMDISGDLPFCMNTEILHLFFTVYYKRTLSFKLRPYLKNKFRTYAC